MLRRHRETLRDEKSSKGGLVTRRRQCPPNGRDPIKNNLIINEKKIKNSFEFSNRILIFARNIVLYRLL